MSNFALKLIKPTKMSKEIGVNKNNMVKCMVERLKSNKIDTYDPSLLNELRDYKPLFNYKAERVYRKCLMAGKTELAKRIACKYGLNNLRDDMITSFGYSLFLLK